MGGADSILKLTEFSLGLHLLSRRPHLLQVLSAFVLLLPLVAALDALALGTAPLPVEVALAVVLEAVRLLASAPVGRTVLAPAREQPLLVAAIQALAVLPAGESLLEALAVILLALSLGARALPHCHLLACTCSGETLLKRGVFSLGVEHGLVVVGDTVFFNAGWLGDQCFVDVCLYWGG